MRRTITALLVVFTGCGDGSGGSGLGDGGGGADGAVSLAAYNETDPPAAVPLTPAAGGSAKSAAGLLEVTFRANAVVAPMEFRVVRLTGADVPADAFLGIAHRVEPVLPYYNATAEATWTIPGALVGAAYGAPASSSRAPLPVARMVMSPGGKTNEPLYVSEYELLDGGGFKLRANVSSPHTALYLSKHHSVAEVTGVAPTPNQPGGADFTIKPAPGSGDDLAERRDRQHQHQQLGVRWRHRRRGRQPGPAGALRRHLRLPGYSARLSFEVKGKLTIGGRALDYNATLGTSVSCPR
jgi:hypothetical protein